MNVSPLPVAILHERKANEGRPEGRWTVDEALVVRAQAGDAHAFAVLASSAIDRLYAVAYRILRETELARDATQDALLEAWRDIPSLRDPRRWEAWTYRLVVHACYNQRRSERRLSATIQFLSVNRSSVPDTALSVADRGYVIDGGRIVHEGAADKLRTDPAVEQAYLGV